MAVVLLGGIFLFLFRDPIARFIDRIRTVSREGIRSYDERQLSTSKPDAFNEFLASFQSPLLREVEARIEQDIKDRGLSKSDDAWKALVKSYAGTLIALQFETIQNRIFASQVTALTILNRQTEPVSLVDLKLHFFDKAATDFPSLHSNRTFEQWYEFLKAYALVAPAGDSVQVSIRGREFLKWRVETGRSGPWVG
ncbi:MAG: hypothetical protein OXC95_08205 [Dehalococcoidia bacterium]|nr:hypothetical protein [Dehalococcoidia bacterium]